MAKHKSTMKFPDKDYIKAATHILTKDAAEAYAKGDMTVTDDVGHELIATEACRIAGERNEHLGQACRAYEKGFITLAELEALKKESND